MTELIVGRLEIHHAGNELRLFYSLFEDDFEDGNSDGWTVIEGKWEVVEDTPGNHVYKGIGTFWGYTIAGSDEWKNYAFEVKAKGVESSKSGANYAGLDVRVDWGAGSCERYASRLEFANWIGGGKYGEDCSNKNWEGRFYRVEMGKWYLLRFEAIEDTLKFYVDNELMFESIDSELETGYIGLSVGENGTIYFDDVRVIAMGE